MYRCLCSWAVSGAVTLGVCAVASADVQEFWSITGGTALVEFGSGQVTAGLNQSTLEGVSGDGLFRAFTAGSASFSDPSNKRATYELLVTPETQLMLHAATGTYTLGAWDAVFDRAAGQFVIGEAQLLQVSPGGETQIAGHISLWLNAVITNVQVTEQVDPEPVDVPEICPNPTTGPDVIVGALSDIGNYGQVNGIYAYSVGTTSCNLGTVPVMWVSGTNQHPVIGQNLYRYRVVNGASRMEQIGLSWLKHGFTALAGSLCCPCTNPGTGALLGVGCSDPYVASLNGSQSLLGPRSHVNAATGCYPYPFTNPPQTACGGGNNYIIPPAAAATIGRRLQVLEADLNPVQNAGAIYFVEGQYISADDSTAGNDNNNASYRRAAVGPGPSYLISLPVQYQTQQQKAAIIAWQDTDPTVSIVQVDIPSDGRMTLGYSVTNVCGGVWHYEYALYNMNSNRSAQQFIVPVPDDVTVANMGFHDTFYHSGELYSSADWSAERANGKITWSTQAYADNVNANALRWGSTYNFRYDANTAPVTVDAMIGLFKPGAVTSVNVSTKGPQALPATFSIASSNPPTGCLNPYKQGQPYRDVLDTGSGATVTAGIGAEGTANQGPIAFNPITVSFTTTPPTPLTPENVTISCTDIVGNGDVDCPTITAITGSGLGPYSIALSAGIPPRECVTLTFPDTPATDKLQYQSLPGDTNLDGVVSTQDLLYLVQRVNDGTAVLPANLARYNIDRSADGLVNTQDFLRHIQLLNGTNTTQVFNGATTAACP